jgi:hypothetical protein
VSTNESFSSLFERQRYAVYRSVLAPALAASLYERVKRMAETGALAGDALVPGTPAAYGDPVMERLMDRLRPNLEKITGLHFFPTYSYFRLYKRGDTLPRHKDRPSCEVSVSLNLGQHPAEPWPLWVAGPLGETAVDLWPGDALIYRGIECDHWREAFHGDDLAQVFLHYVEQDGTHSEWKFDKREALSVGA